MNNNFGQLYNKQIDQETNFEFLDKSNKCINQSFIRSNQRICMTNFG